MHNDILLGLKATALHSHIVLALVRINSPSSPRGECVRWQQVKTGLAETQLHSTHLSNALFKEFFQDVGGRGWKRLLDGR